MRRVGETPGASGRGSLVVGETFDIVLDVLHLLERHLGERQRGRPTSPTGLTSRLFEIPGGRILVVAIGIGTAAVGIYHLQKGLRGEFFDDIRTTGLTRWQRAGLRVAAAVGFSARATMLGIAGWLFIEAARRYDPERAAGLDQSLRTLTSVAYGRLLLVACGIGLAAAGAYDVLTFRRQRIDDES